MASCGGTRSIPSISMATRSRTRRIRIGGPFDERTPHDGRAPRAGPEGPAPRDWQLAGAPGGAAVGGVRHLGCGLATRAGDPLWAAAGFAIAMGWAGLSLHNDCRYKAFFQRLKRETCTYRVQGGGGGRPAPPAPWPRRGLRALSWPAFKSCE